MRIIHGTFFVSDNGLYIWLILSIIILLVGYTLQVFIVTLVKYPQFSVCSALCLDMVNYNLAEIENAYKH